MSDLPKNPTLELVRDPGTSDESAQEAVSCPAPPPPAPSPSKTRKRRQVTSRRPAAKPKQQHSPEEAARRRAEVRRRRRDRIAQIDVNNLPEVIGVPEVALLLRLSAGTVYTLAAQKKIPCRRCLGSFRFSKSAVLGWLGAQSSDSQPSR